nr:VanZ family protein [uncultured Caproiciproducens sp.]
MERNESNKKYQYLLTFTVVIYVYLLLSVVIFKTLESPMDLFTGNHPDFRSLNLIPFKDIWDSNLSVSSNKTSIIGNIILFVPLGVLLKLLLSEPKYNMLKSVLIVLTTSLLIEITQYIARIGVSDINDLILNTAGGFIGILISALLIKWVGKNRAKKAVAVLGSIVAVIMVVLEAILFIAN